MAAMFWLFLWMLGPQSAAPNSITGTVVRAGTSRPLAGVQVGLWPTAVSVRTDTEGRFELRNVAPGEYALVVVHDGMKLRAPVNMTAARRIENITLEVKSPPAIAGTVFDPNGERVAAARVQAHRMVHLPTGPTMRSVMSVLTDDLGQYRLYRLSPGEYYVSAALSDRERAIAGSGLRLSPNLSKADLGFPPVFFGGGYTPYTSQPVRLGREYDSAGVDIFIKDGPRLAVNGRLTGPGGDMCGRLAVVPEGGLIDESSDFSESVCGPFRIDGLAPGVYVILATTKGFASDVVRVTVQSENVEGVTVAMSPTKVISGRISRDGNVNLPEGARVVLSRSSRDISRRIEGDPILRDGRFTVPDVGPGVFEVYVDPLPANTYLQGFPQRGIDPFGSGLRVDSSIVTTLNIQLRSSTIRADGVVVDYGGRPAPGAEVVLVPRANRNREDRYIRAVADAVGAFSLAGIAPGTYVAFAFEEIEEGAYYVFSYDFRLLDQYARRGQTLDLGEGAQEALRLIAVPATDTAGGIR